MRLRTPEEIIIKGVNLSEILDSHEIWLENYKKGECANLSKTDLSFVNLSDKNLSYADFFQANLLGANLRKSIFTRAKMSAVNLFGANLEGVNFFDTDLTGAILTKAKLLNAILMFTNLRYSEMQEANITGVVFKEALTLNWKIDGIKCDYIFLEEKQKQKQPKEKNFDPGEFESLYKSLPTIELIIEQGISPKAYMAAAAFELELVSGENNFELAIDKFDITNKRIILTTKPGVNIDAAKKHAESSFNEYLVKQNEELLSIMRQKFLEPTIQIAGNSGNIAIGGSSITDNSLKITIENIEALIREIDGAPELQGENKAKEKGKIKNVLRECLKDITKDGLTSAGKYLLKQTLEKAKELAPSLIPLATQVLQNIG